MTNNSARTYGQPSGRTLIGLAGGLACLVFAVKRLRRRNDLDGKQIVITGGSRGLGLAIAEACLSRGANVSLVARSEAELERAHNHLAAYVQVDRRVLTYVCDVRDRFAVQALVARIQSVSAIDILINNAAVIYVAPAEDHAWSSFEDSLQTNLAGAIHASYAVLPNMLERSSGHIVNIASIGGIVAVPHLLPYSTSKFALVGFSRGLAAEMATKGIQVLTVSPWLIRTGSHLKAHFAGQSKSEYQWFSAGATLPLISVSPEYTALSIVKAIERGSSELLISPWSHLAGLIGTMAPSLATRLLGVVNSVLPNASADRNTVIGASLDESSPDPITDLGRNAASRWNQ